jgi:hypothetical protein
MKVGTWRVSTAKVGATTSTIATTLDRPTRQHKHKIEIYYDDSTIPVKEIYLEQNNNSLQSFNFETNLKGLGAATMVFVYYDFPVDPDGVVKYFYDGVLKYQGIIDNIPDPKGGAFKIQPRHTRLKEVLYNGSPGAGKTIKEMLQAIIEDSTEETGIEYNASFVEITDTDTFTLSWSYEPANKIIDGLVDKLDGFYWGVNAENKFFVKQYSTTLDRLYLQNAAPSFTELKTQTDYTKITATRYQVFRKRSATDSDTKYAGQVGYDTGAYVAGSNWPTPAIEKLTRRREVKLTLSEIFSSDAEALDFAYAELLKKTAVPTTGTINGIPPESAPEPFELVLAEDFEETQLFTIESCDALTKFDAGWSLDQVNYVEGGASVKFTSDADTAYDRQYDFGSIYRADKVGHIEQLGFMVRADIAGAYLYFSTGTTLEDHAGAEENGLNENGIGEDFANNLWDTEYLIQVPNANQWFYISIDWPGDFRYLGWRTKNQAATVNIDRVQLYGYNKQRIESNVVKTAWKIDSNGVVVSATLGSLDLQAYGTTVALQKESEKLKTITKGA